MKRGTFDWRRGRGWFRVWLLLTIAWYLFAGFNLMREDLEDTWRPDLAFNTKEELRSHLDSREAQWASACVPGTMNVQTSVESLSDYEVWWRSLSDAKRLDLFLDEREGERRGGPPTDRVRGERTDRFVLDEVSCTSAWVVREIVKALLAPFAAVIVALLVYYFSRLLLGGGRYVGGWVAEGFRPGSPQAPGSPQSTEQVETAKRPTFKAEFWFDMKPVLKAAGIAILAAWVVYLLSTRTEATLHTISATLVTGAGVFVIGAILLLFRMWRRKGGEEADEPK